MTRLVNRLLSVTIWAPGTFGTPPDRYANLYRVVLPVFDLALIYSGVWAILYGAPSITDYTTYHVGSIVWGGWLLVAAILCLLGVTIPHLFTLEAIGKSAVLAALVVYLAAMVLLTTSVHPERGVVSGLASGGILLASWRLGDIRTEVRKRRQARELHP